MAEKRRTYEDRVREREDALLKLETNLAESRLAAAQAKPFNPEIFVDKPVHPKSNKVFMGAGAVIILFLIVAVILAFRSPSPGYQPKPKAAPIEESTDSQQGDDSSEKN